MTGRPLLAAEDLVVTFRVPGGRRLHAVDKVTLGVRRAEVVALVGESGSGKSTVAMALMRAFAPDSGRIVFDGDDITRREGRALLPFRRRVQLVFQNPYASLNPRLTVRRIVAEPLATHRWGTRAEIDRRVDELLTQVGLSPDLAGRVPAQFSGGQRQRIAIARALALGPEVLIADEPVSALDVSIQAQIVNLLQELQARLGIAYLVIAHDLALVHQISHRIAVMYLGEIVEEGAADDVVGRPLHPYTAALLSATPREDADGRPRIVLAGEPPSAVDRPSGCRFHPRCPIARPACATRKPELATAAPGRRVACFHPGEIPPPVTLAED